MAVIRLTCDRVYEVALGGDLIAPLCYEVWICM